MLENLNEEEIYKLLLEKIKYNDFEYNKKARNKYIGKKPNAYGIDKILYKCPNCKTEYNLYTEDDSIICKCCGLKVKVNEYYDLESTVHTTIPKDIDEWYKWQRRCVVNEIKDNNFEIVSSYLNTDNYYNTVDYTNKVALVIGNEANGVNDELIGQSDTLVKIPIYGKAESLNAAISSAILMYEIKKYLV